MLSEITIQDYQSHKNATIKFGPGVNIISGLSNSGKTAIIRAINFVANNRPLGDGFINDDADSVEVTVVINEKGEVFGVSRGKGKKENYYQIVTLKDDITLTAFGTDVPEEVSKLINFSDINIQKQLSPYFLVLETPGVAAQYIREVAKLDEIDKTVKLLDSQRRQAEVENKSVKIDCKEVEEELRELDRLNLSQLEEWISQLDLIEKQEDAIFLEVDELKRITDSAASIVPRLSALQAINFSAIQTDVSLAKDVMAEYTEVFAMVQELDHIIQVGRSIEQCIKAIPDFTAELKMMRVFWPEHGGLVSDTQDLSAFIGKVEDIEEAVFQLDNQMKLAEEERDVLLNALVECPSCGVFLTTQSKKQLLENS